MPMQVFVPVGFAKPLTCGHEKPMPICVGVGLCGCGCGWPVPFPKNNMPAALSLKVFFPIKEEPISDTKANKENIPPTPIPFNFKQELIPLYNREITDPMLYHLHNQQNFHNLADDTDLCMFDSAYCCHCLLSKKEKALGSVTLRLA